MNVTRLETKHAAQLAAADKICISPPWTEKMFLGDLESGSTRYFGIFDGEVLAAYGGMWLAADEAQITNIAVLPEYRRKGYGKAILDALKNEAKKTAAVMLLEVRAGNAPAIALYENQGFHPCGVRKNYYRDPIEDAVLMSCDLG